MPGVDGLRAEEVRGALRLLGEDEATITGGSTRVLRERFTTPGVVAALLDRAPEGVSTLFRRLALDGAASVEDLLGRGWAGVGALPEPLDWLQRRALITVGPGGLVHAIDEARHGFATLTFDLPEPDPADATPLLVESARTVVIADTEAALNRATAVHGAALVAVSKTVAISDRSPEAVQAALESAGAAVSSARAQSHAQPTLTLPGAEDDAVGPRAIRTIISQALDEQRQLRLEYYASSRGGQATERIVDPWEFADDLLRGWCHLRSDERSFAVDRIGRARLLAAHVAHPPPR